MYPEFVRNTVSPMAILCADLIRANSVNLLEGQPFLPWQNKVNPDQAHSTTAEEYYESLLANVWDN